LGAYAEETTRLIANNVAGMEIADYGNIIPEEASGMFVDAIEPLLRPLDSH